MLDRLRGGLGITICCVVRDCKGWLGFLAEVVSYLDSVGVGVNVVLVEDGSTDGTDAVACRLLAKFPGILIKLGQNSEFSSLTRTEKLAHLRNVGLEQCLRLDGDWTMFLDSNIYFRLSIPLEMIGEAAAIGIDGLLTPFTLGSYVRLHTRQYLAIKRRSYREQHYFDTFALQLADGTGTFPACPFSNCRKCTEHLVDKRDMRALRTKSAFGGLGLIETATLRNTGATWPRQKIGAVCEHIFFCTHLRDSVPGYGTYILTQFDAYCDRTT